MNKSKAFTLIEMLVAVTIFSLVIGSASGLLISAIRSQTKALASQKILDETSFVMEYMSRALRMAKKELNCPGVDCCLIDNGNGYNYENPGLDTTRIKFIRFIGTQDVCQEFRLNSVSDQLEEYRDGIFFGELTSDGLEVSSLQFNLIGVAQPPTDDLQPRVTISMKIKKAGVAKPEIKIQTTISQRNLDVQQ